MRSLTFPFAALVTGLSLCALHAAEEDKAALEALSGVWDVVAIQVGGRTVDVGNGSPDKIVIKSGKITIWAQDKPFAIFKDGAIELGPKKNPRAIDVVLAQGTRIPAIYELKDKELKLAIPRAPDKPDEPLMRPESFDTKGRPVVLLITRRSGE